MNCENNNFLYEAAFLLILNYQFAFKKSKSKGDNDTDKDDIEDEDEEERVKGGIKKNTFKIYF